MRRLIPSIPARLPEATAERVRRNHDERLREIQALPLVQGKLLKHILLTNNATTTIAHGMGRPVSCFVSPPHRPSGSGGSDMRIMRIKTAAVDESTSLQLYAGDWGGDVYVDIWVF